MSLGSFVRKLCGEKMFSQLGTHYREFFFDTTLFIEALPPIESGAQVLDIGGGDGYLLNMVLEKYPDICITMIDPAESVGGGIYDKYRAHVTTKAHTYVEDYDGPTPQYIFLFDVVHHVKLQDRKSFFASLHKHIGDGATVIIKDVEPQGVRAKLGYWSDYYVSGDKTVSPIAQKDIVQFLREHNANVTITETPVYKNDAPNYCMIVQQDRSQDL